MMLDNYSAADFTPYLNDTFLIHLPEMDPWPVALIAVHELKEMRGGFAGKDEPNHAFSLIFRSEETERYLGQRIYDMEHPEMGRLSIFLVPIGPDPASEHKGIRYEAVFG